MYPIETMNPIKTIIVWILSIYNTLNLSLFPIYTLRASIKRFSMKFTIQIVLMGYIVLMEFIVLMGYMYPTQHEVLAFLSKVNWLIGALCELSTYVLRF